MKSALAELRRVEVQCQALGLGMELQYCVRPAPSHYSGLLVQLCREKQGKGGSRRVDVLAAGGRYDQMVRLFSETFRLAAPAREEEAGVAATGISISVDKVVAALARQDSWGPSLCQVVVGGDREEAARLATQLWAGGVAARLEEAARGDGLLELAREVGAELVVVCGAEGGALVAQPDREGRWLERKVGAGEGGLARWGLGMVASCSQASVGCVLDRPNTLHSGEGREREERGGSTAKPQVNYNFQFLDRERYYRQTVQLYNCTTV